MTSAQGEGQADDRVDEAAVVIRDGTEQFLSAKTNVEQRSALIMWLRGAASAAEEHLDVYHPNGSPGKVLAAALADLNAGFTPSLLKAAKAGTLQRIELNRARARAVAAVEIVVEFQQVNGHRKNVRKAIEAVAHLCGMNPGSLRSLRAHVQSGKLYRSTSGLVDEEKVKLEDYVRAFQLMGRDEAHALTSLLMADRALLASAK